MSNLDMAEYKGWIGLSPPAAYPSTVEHEANEGSLQSRQHVYTIDYYSSVLVKVIRLYQGPSTRVFAARTNDEPANK